MGVVRTGAVITVAGLFVVACNALSGVGDLEVDLTTDGGSSLIDGAVDAPTDVATAPTDSGTDAPVDSGTDAPSGPLSCADTGGHCVPATPDGWNGPFLEFNQAQDGSIPDCPDSTPDQYDLGAGDPSLDFTCGNCKCSGVTGVTCATSVQEFEDATCDTLFSGADGSTCTANPMGIDGAVIFTLTPSAGGNCTPQVAGQPQYGDNLTWSNGYRRYCGSDNFAAVGCSTTDQRCLPSGPNGRYCIAIDGDEDCPADWPLKELQHTDVDDGRSCSPSTCKCDAPTNVACGGLLRTYSSNACGVGGSNVKAGDCAPLAAAGSFKGSNIAVNSGNCLPHGSPTVQGQILAKASTITTACCLP